MTELRSALQAGHERQITEFREAHDRLVAVINATLQEASVRTAGQLEAYSNTNRSEQRKLEVDYHAMDQRISDIERDISDRGETFP